jgi:hypothetical protein
MRRVFRLRTRASDFHQATALSASQRTDGLELEPPPKAANPSIRDVTTSCQLSRGTASHRKPSYLNSFTRTLTSCKIRQALLCEALKLDVVYLSGIEANSTRPVANRPQGCQPAPRREVPKL